MNLVQVQERLKDLPTNAVMAYANGSNPDVPAYVALGELKRRESMEKDAAMHQQAQQGPQPTVKDQVEKQVGLLSLQRQQQQQAAQQQAQQAQRQPQPVPPNIPQPQAQPEVEPQMAMAGGGVAALPVRNEMFEYGSGGIIAFAGEEGSQVPEADPVAAILSRDDLTIEQKKAALAQLTKAAEPGIKGMAPVGPTGQLAQGLLAKEQAAPTPESIIEAEGKLRPEEMKQPYGAEAKQRIAGLQSLYQKSTEDRPYERLLSVLGGMGRGSLGGAGPAYLQSVQAERAADMAQAQKENEALTSIEEKARGEAKDIYGKRSDLYKSATENFSADARNRLTSAIQAYGVERQAADAALNRINNLEVQKLHNAALNKPGETERLIAQYAAIKAKDPAKAEEWMRDLERVKTGSRGELSRASLVEKFAKDWNTMDLMARENYKKEGIKNVDEYVEKMVRLTGGGANPPSAGNIKSAVESAGYTYEPTKYDYRVNPDTGTVQRKPKE